MGLRNIGSSCYLNSVMQTILSVPEVGGHADVFSFLNVCECVAWVVFCIFKWCLGRMINAAYNRMGARQINKV